MLRSVVAQRVLVAGFQGDALIGALDRFLGELVQHVAAGGVGVARQDVAVAEAGNARLRDLVIDRHGGCVHADGIDRDFVGQQHLQHLGIAGAAAVLLAVADDEDDLAVLAGTVGQFLRRRQDGIVQHVILRLRE